MKASLLLDSKRKPDLPSWGAAWAWIERPNAESLAGKAWLGSR
jgi:hypothetical protein